MATRLDPVTMSSLWARLPPIITFYGTMKSVLALQAGDVMTIESPAGGGYGSPARRPDELITRDLEEGYVSSWPGRNGSGGP